MIFLNFHVMPASKFLSDAASLNCEGISYFNYKGSSVLCGCKKSLSVHYYLCIRGNKLQSIY